MTKLQSRNSIDEFIEKRSKLLKTGRNLVTENYAYQRNVQSNEILNMSGKHNTQHFTMKTQRYTNIKATPYNGSYVRNLELTKEMSSEPTNPNDTFEATKSTNYIKKNYQKLDDFQRKL